MTDIEANKYDPSLSINRSGGIKILGTPVGSTNFCEAVISDRIKKIKSLIETSCELNNSQLEFILLKNCLGLPKFSYNLRTYNFLTSVHLLTEFDNMVLNRLADLLAHTFNPSSPTWIQASLPLTSSGLGITLATDIASIAYLSSYVDSKPLQDTLITNTPDIDLSNNIINFDHKSDISFDLIIESTAFNTTRSTQNILFQEIVKKKYNQLLELSINPTDKARILSCTGKYNGAWLDVVPLPSLGLALTTSEFSRATCLRLGLTQTNANSLCQMCFKHEMDALGNHALNCKHGSERIGRHDKISDIIFLQCQKALLHPTSESRCDHTSQNRSDIEIPNWIDGKTALLDIGITNPTCQSNLSNAAITPGYAIEKYETAKLLKYQDICENESKICIPIISETFGKWSTTAIKTLKRITKFIAQKNDEQLGSSFTQLMQRLSLSVQKSNVHMISCRIRTPS